LDIVLKNPEPGKLREEVIFPFFSQDYAAVAASDLPYVTPWRFLLRF
jgi:hypothetical protein